MLLLLLALSLYCLSLWLLSSGQPLAFKLFLNYFLQASTSISLLIVPPIYLNIYWIIPEFLIKKRYAYYVLILIVLIVFWGAILAYVEPWIDRHWFDQPARRV